MANIYKRPRSPFWWISYTTGTSRVRVSTGVRHDGRKLPPKDSPVLEIRRSIEERLARVKFGAAPMLEPKPVAQFLADYLASLQGVRESSITRYRFTVSAFTRWAANEGVATVADVTYPVSSRYVAFRRGAGIGAATMRSEVGFLNSAWVEAKKLHHCDWDENPWTFTFKLEAKEAEPFTDSELTAILSQPMAPWLRLAIEVALYTGARISSIRGLCWEDITMESIHFRTSKTTSFTVPLHPNLSQFLGPLRGSGPVLPAEVLARTDGYISNVFRVLCRRAGVSRGHFHLFRHTFISRLAMAGVEQRVTQLLANHSSGDVHRAYTHANAAALAPHLERLTYPRCANGVPEPAAGVSN